MHLLIATLVLSLLGDNGAGGGPEKPDGADGRSGPTAADRGRRALTGRSFLSPEWELDAYRGASRSGRRRGPRPGRSTPRATPSAFAPPLRPAPGAVPQRRPADGPPPGDRADADEEAQEPRVGFQVDCLVCHGGSIGGTSYVGLGNTQLDMIGFYRDFFAADGRPILLHRLHGQHRPGRRQRRPDGRRPARASAAPTSPGGSCRVPHGRSSPRLDVPAWWTAEAQADDVLRRPDRRPTRSARSCSSCIGEKSREQFEELEPTFADILAYIKSIEPPAYPFPIDRAVAERGRVRLRAELHPLPRDLRRGPDLPEPDRRARRHRHRPGPGPGPFRDALVDHYNASWFGEHYPVDEDDGRLPGPAARRHLGDRPLPAQRLGADPPRPARLADPPRSLPPAPLDRLRALRPRPRRLEVEVLEPLDPESRRRPRPLDLRHLAAMASATRATPSATPLTEAERMAVIEYLKTL